MKIQRVYTDTSVIGGCFDPEFEQWSKRLFEDFRLGLFVPVVSSVVTAEIEGAPKDVRQAYEELLAFDAEVLLVTAVDLVVSSTFRHIVHYDKIRAFNAVNLERGYKPVQIYSPREVTHHGEAEEGD